MTTYRQLPPFTYKIYFGRALDTYKSNDKMNRHRYIFKDNEALAGVTLLHNTSTIGKINNNNLPN